MASRWYNAAMLSLLHCFILRAAVAIMRKLSFDVEYNGMVLPKGATVNIPFYPLFRTGIEVQLMIFVMNLSIRTLEPAQFYSRALV